MAAPVLYTALTDLEISSAYASWPAPQGSTFPLDPAAYTTLRLLGNGSIEPAAPNAVDDTTPKDCIRGVPGLHHGVSN